MKWSKKAEMISLHNNDETSEFEKFVLENIADFDNQSWDMFTQCVTLIPSIIEEKWDFYGKVYENGLADLTLDNFNIRTQMRLSMLQVLCEEISSKKQPKKD